jgi:hypothetical protein
MAHFSPHIAASHRFSFLLAAIIPVLTRDKVAGSGVVVVPTQLPVETVLVSMVTADIKLAAV